MRLFRQSAVALAMLVAASADLLAQRRLSGRVIEEGAGQPLGSASVQIAGTTTGTYSADNGTFALTVPNGTVTLRVRRIGYQLRSVIVSATQSSVEVQLKKDILQLETQVVTGQQGSIDRKNAATAIVQVTGEDLARVPAVSVDQALQGKVVGARINMNSGAPGGGGQIQIRGTTSVLGNGEPLFVIDGVIMSNASIAGGQNSISRATGFAGNVASVQDNRTNRLADLNPAEIEDIQVLKGAAASAIYGSRATNGVVIITTKRGRSGQPRWSVTTRVGSSDMLRGLGQRRFLDTASAIDAATQAANATIARQQVQTIAAANGGQLPFNDFTAQLYGRTPLSWQSAVNVLGGNDNTRYSLSAGRQFDNGLAVNTNATRDNARINVDQNVTSRLTARLDLSYTRSTANRGISNNSNTPVTSPIYVFGATPSFFDLRTRDAQGNFPVNRFGGNANSINTSNPFQTLQFVTNEEDVDRVVGAAELNYQLYAGQRHNLRISYLLGVDRFTQQNELYSPNFMQYEPSDGLLGTSVEGNAVSRQLNQLLRVNYEWAPESFPVRGTTVAGLTQEEQGLNITRNRALGLVPGIPNINQGQQLTFQNREFQRDQAWFAQQQFFGFDDRLFVALSLRGDRSSNNGDVGKFYIFPGYQASYRFVNALPGVNEFKLRASLGETGNRPLYGQRFVVLGGNGLIGGVNGLGAVATLGNPNIRPERMREAELGFDMQLFRSRVAVEFTHFDRRVTDALLLRNLIPTAGVTTQFDNVGRIRLRGQEVAVNVVPVQRQGFTWVSRTAFQRIRNWYEDATNVNPFPPNVGFGAAYGRPRIATGVSTTAIWGNMPVRLNLNGRDTTVVRDTILPGRDGTPDFEMFFTNTFTVGRFSLSTQVDWRRGGAVSNVTQNVFDQYRNARDHDQASPCRGVTSLQRTDCTRLVGGVVQLVPDTAATGTLGQYRWNKWNGGQDARVYVQDGSFVKLREVALAYQVPQSLSRRLLGQRVGDVRLSLVGRNLAIFSPYWGPDPEVSNFGNNNIGRFVDLAAFPPTRQFFFSVDVGF
jgi:TonB-linked SusC/RagA family outer membrane protein